MEDKFGCKFTRFSLNEQVLRAKSHGDCRFHAGFSQKNKCVGYKVKGDCRLNMSLLQWRKILEHRCWECASMLVDSAYWQLLNLKLDVKARADAFC